MIAQVIIALDTAAVDRVFDYLIPADVLERRTCVPGVRVVVPLRGMRATAVVLRVTDASDYAGTLRELISVVDDAPLATPALLDVALFVREHTFCTYYQALRLVLPIGIKLRIVTLLSLADGADVSRYDGACAELLDELREADVPLHEVCTSARQRRALQTLFADGVVVRSYRYLRDVDVKYGTRYTLNGTLERILGDIPPRATLQRTVVEYIAEHGGALLSDLSRDVNGARGAAVALHKKGLLTRERVWDQRNPVGDVRPHPPHELSPSQQTIYDDVIGRYERGETVAALLHGVTGSGKTEVYLRLTEYMLSKGRGVIVLVPEVSLTPQAVQRYAGRLGDTVTVLHSYLSKGERYDQWLRIRDGDARVVIGARSAVFAPIDNLGLIIVDEEHEDTYRSDTPPEYDATVVAAERCRRENAILLRGSATPCVTTYHAAMDGRLMLYEMPSRIGDASLPDVYVVDMRDELRQGNRTMLSKRLAHTLRTTVENGEQAILFLNKRGYNSAVVCRSCGEPVYCARCSIPLTYHKYNGTLLCHFCNYALPDSGVCPSCGSGFLKRIGTGTERVEDELDALLPGVPHVRMDGDTVRLKGAHADILQRFESGQCPILLGTQMVTKGLDFPSVTLCAVLCADITLSTNDYRAAERTFAQLVQLAGRSGRKDRRGRAFIQTYQPEHYAVRLACTQDYADFYANEIALRERLSYPPYCDIVVLLSTGEDESAVQSELGKAVDLFVDYVKRHKLKVQMLRPAPCPYAKLRDLFRYRAVIKMIDAAAHRAVFVDIIERCQGVRVSVNPNDMQ